MSDRKENTMNIDPHTGKNYGLPPTAEDLRNYAAEVDDRDEATQEQLDMLRLAADRLEQLERERDDAREQEERFSDDALRLMQERNEAMDRLAKLDEECGLNPIPESHYIKTLQAYDRLAIVMEAIMELWLEGNANPPKELIDAYYDAKADINDHINPGRLHESIIPANANFYNTIQQKFKFDDTPNLW